jgi:hypothetical protein
LVPDYRAAADLPTHAVGDLGHYGWDERKNGAAVEVGGV